ncbi:hypothetical protein CDV31_016451 [Fusarium ambrosium]|uniref:MHYT domain-containing protein n=1 Tax=Fusarium ambrosium TaxID=131363 RepID=A0A428S8V1_9HYPO|nr:hypothetical protein CDV31_016451 [Fusarium ambrosium]
MGGIGIWCMYFIGNRAIILANREPDLQIAYSNSITTISLFIPIVVLLAAFIAIGTNNYTSWWRVTIGGILYGSAICEMQYLGNRSIKNYMCIYKPASVAGAAIIAVFASIISLSIFFMFRGVWAHSWWKRYLSAVIVTGAVSGIQWCAVVGTRYRLIHMQPENKKPSKIATVIVIICLSLGACAIIAGSAVLRARRLKKSAIRAQQITLGTTIFDKHGRILVDPDGIIPSIAITDLFLEKASRNWGGISTLLDSMKYHLLQLPHLGSGKSGVQLVDEHGEVIKDYDVIFRELFCIATLALAEKLGEPMASMGVLWDDILPTGAFRRRETLRQKQHGSPRTENGSTAKGEDGGGVGVAEQGLSGWRAECGRGALMFLVRRVQEGRDVDRLTSAGFRFAELHQVSHIIQARMQIQSNDFESVLYRLAMYAGQDRRWPSGACIGLFAVRAPVDCHGFQVLVRKGARHALPSKSLEMDTIEGWHVDFLRQFQGIPVSSLVFRLSDACVAPASSKEEAFARQIGEAIRSLRKFMKEPLFEQAVLSPTIVHLPGRDDQAQAVMITLQLVVPIHSVLSSPDYEFVSLDLLKMYQVSDNWHQEFMRGVHREFGALLLAAAIFQDSFSDAPGQKLNGDIGQKLDLTRFGTVKLDDDLAKPRSCDDWRTPPPFGGILVFKEVTVNINEGQGGDGDRKSQDITAVETPNGPHTASMPGIELQPMAYRYMGTNAHIGSQVSKVDGDVSNIATFIDTLLEEAVRGGPGK